VLVVRSTAVTAPMLESGALSLVVRAGAGYNTIDVATASKRGIYVSNCPGKNAIAVAELAFALLLALDRRVPDNVAELRAGRWNKKEFSKARGLFGRTIGLLGYGNIGQEMAKRAHAFGMPIVVWSRRFASGAERIEDQPIPMHLAASPQEVAAQCDVLITMLPNSPDVEQVALGPGGIIEGARRGLIFADMSTISPIVSKKIGKALEAKGVAMLDAPVSGGEKGAIDGALSIMVGGDKAVFERVLPIFQAMGKTITLLGPLGFGGFTKLANQIIVAVNLTALAEALTLGKKAGLDRDLLLTALAGGLAGSKCLEQKRANYMANTYSPGFKVDLHFKDLGLIMESARELGVPLPATAVVQELFNALRVKGRGGLDHSGVITLLEDLAGAS